MPEDARPLVRRLAVFDLDKTLLDDRSLLPEATVARMRAVQMPGLACTIASGRDFEHIRPFLEQLAWSMVPVVAEQGAVIISPDGKRMFLERMVSRAVLLASAATVRTSAVPLNIVLYGRDEPQVFRSMGAPCFIRGPQAEWYAAHMTVIPDDGGIRTDGIRKISVRCLPEATETVRELLVKNLGAQANAVIADAGFINVMDANVDKGIGLHWVMEYLGIRPEHVMAVGDCEADWSMLRAAGIPVAVGNADAETRALARYVVPSNMEGGGAFALEHFAAGAFGG